MSEDDLSTVKTQVPGAWAQHKLMVMIAGSIVIAMFLVGVAMALYASSGAAQLDLSRPGYVSVRKQATRSDQFDSFSATGEIDKASLDQFRKLYDEQAKKVSGIDSFGGNVMSDESLSIDAPTE